MLSPRLTYVHSALKRMGVWAYGCTDEETDSHTLPPPRLHTLYALVGLLLVGLLPSAATAQVLPSFGRDRSGTSGFQFLKIPVDARSAAMGQTVAANAFDASALLWNPALTAQLDGPHVGFSHTAYFADVSLDYAAVTYPLRRFGLTLGASVQALNSGEMEVTTEFNPFGTGETFRLTDVAAGLTVAQNLTDLFSYGITAKYLRESVAGLTSSTAVFDIGVFYRVGTTGAQMAVSIRNFGFDAQPTGEIERIVIGEQGPVVENDFASLTPPTTFLMGATYTMLRNDERNDLLISGQLNNPNDNAETFNVGVEYTWNRLLILRGGYRFGVEEATWPSLGGGLMVPELFDQVNVRFDYSFNRLDRLGTVNRVGLNLSL